MTVLDLRRAREVGGDDRNPHAATDVAHEVNDRTGAAHVLRRDAGERENLDRHENEGHADGREDTQQHQPRVGDVEVRSEEHTSELQSLTRISYAVFCLKKK